MAHYTATCCSLVAVLSQCCSCAAQYAVVAAQLVSQLPQSTATTRLRCSDNDVTRQLLIRQLRLRSSLSCDPLRIAQSTARSQLWHCDCARCECCVIMHYAVDCIRQLRSSSFRTPLRGSTQPFWFAVKRNEVFKILE